MVKSLRIFAVFSLYLSLSLPLSYAAGVSASVVRSAALSQDTVYDSIDYIKSNLSKSATASDRRSLLYFLGMLQEQLGLYSDASLSYAQAAGIAASDAAGMPKVTSEQLVLNAVRTSLNSGDYDTAERYLNSAVKNSRNTSVLAYVKLYGVWAELCRARTLNEAQKTISILRTYADSSDMKTVRPAILLTLWYITDEAQYGNILKTEYPSSPEAGIVQGTVQIASVPFWYFVPRASLPDPVRHEDASVKSIANPPAGTSTQPAAPTQTKKEAETKSIKNTLSYKREPSSGPRRQLGLFRVEENAQKLVQKVREKGFDAYFYEKKKESDVHYFVVVDDDARGTMEKRLKDAGFDSYPLE